MASSFCSIQKWHFILSFFLAVLYNSLFSVITYKDVDLKQKWA